MTIGEMCRSFLEKLEWFDTRFPRIPVNVEVRQHIYISHLKTLFYTAEATEGHPGRVVPPTRPCGPNCGDQRSFRPAFWTSVSRDRKTGARVRKARQPLSQSRPAL